MNYSFQPTLYQLLKEDCVFNFGHVYVNLLLDYIYQGLARVKVLVMGIISLIIKAFFLYFLFTLIIGAWKFFRTFKMLKNQHGQSNPQFEDLFKERQQSQTQSHQGSGEVFEAEYRVVREE